MGRNINIGRKGLVLPVPVVQPPEVELAQKAAAAMALAREATKAKEDAEQTVVMLKNEIKAAKSTIVDQENRVQMVQKQILALELELSDKKKEIKALKAEVPKVKEKNDPPAEIDPPAKNDPPVKRTKKSTKK